MISELAFLISNALLKNNVIDEQEFSMHIYGFEILISTLITFLIAVLSGYLLHCITVALIYFGIFALLRSICGGYHADTYFKCNIIYFVVTEMVLFIFNFFPVIYKWEYHWISIMFSIIVIYIYAPVENPNKLLSQERKKFFKYLCRVMVTVLAVITTCLEIYTEKLYGILIDTTLLVVSISMFATNPMRGGKKMSKTTKMAKMKVMKVVAAIGKKSALIGCDSASILGFHQPKEPVNLKKSENK